MDLTSSPLIKTITKTRRVTGQHQAGVVVLVLIEILEHHNVSPQDHHPPAQIIQEYPCQIYQVGSQQQHS